LVAGAFALESDFGTDISSCFLYFKGTPLCGMQWEAAFQPQGEGEGENDLNPAFKQLLWSLTLD